MAAYAHSSSGNRSAVVQHLSTGFEYIKAGNSWFERAQKGGGDDEDWRRALDQYKRGTAELIEFCMLTGNERSKREVKAKLPAYLDLAERCQRHLGIRVAATAAPGAQKGVETTTGATADDKKARNTDLGVRWDDVIGLEAAKQALLEALQLPITQPSLFTADGGGLVPWRGVLLYGPPGTGKTQLARATATECKATFHPVKCSDVFGKYVGESEGAIASIFEGARASAPAVIFFDELDSLTPSRDSDSDSGVTGRVLAQMLNEIDGVLTGAYSPETYVLVLGATNKPWAIDDAILRRFDRRLHVPLPHEAARTALFRLHAAAKRPSLTDVEWRVLGKNSASLSGSDIRSCVNYALMRPLKEAMGARHFRRLSSSSLDEEDVHTETARYQACDADDADAEEMSYQALERNALRLRSVSF